MNGDNDDIEFEDKGAHNFGDFIKSRNVGNKGELYTKYMEIIENKPAKQFPSHQVHLFCKTCSTPWTISQNDAIYICQNCGDPASLRNFSRIPSNGQ